MAYQESEVQDGGSGGSLGPFLAALFFLGVVVIIALTVYCCKDVRLHTGAP